MLHAAERFPGDVVVRLRDAGAAAALDREWLETDGLGGYAAGTLSNSASRSYHAVLGPALRPPLGRMVLWALSEETLLPGGSEQPLYAHRFPGVVHPQGHQHLERFHARPWPRWVYRFGDAFLTRELFLLHGVGDVYLGFTWHGMEPVDLRLRPLLAFMDHHAASRRDEAGSMEITAPDRAAFRLRGENPGLHLHVPGSRARSEAVWLEHVILARETERGLPDRADYFRPGEFHLTLVPGQTAWARGSLNPAAAVSPEEAAASELQRRRALTLSLPPDVATLALAADQFLVQRGDKTTVIAGYPWFTDWGRDTMIALPGLTLTTGRPDVARDLLLTFAAHLKDGLIPNRFPDAGDAPEYNTVDATLWMAVAAHATWHVTGDDDLARAMLDVLREARLHHERGTRHGIRVDTDGLLRAGEPGVQLTWMDAKVDGWVVTPRIGKPVEIQALWYNFLRVGLEMEEALGGDPAPWRRLSEAVRAAFLPSFWDPARGYLADVVADDGSRDMRLRPNQIFALSLPFALVNGDPARAVLSRVRERLLTPRGLRSLDPADPEYCPVCEGDRRQRDGAYHQGTVWGWLQGPYLDALLRFGGAEGRAEAQRLLHGWSAHLEEGCVGQLAEVFDGEAPHHPRGCFAQAWTVAEVLRGAVNLGSTTTSEWSP